jgi:hypothetical protein
MTDIRITREAVEVLTETTEVPDIRVTREAVEVLTETTEVPDIRITRVAVEVLVSDPFSAGPTSRTRIMTVTYS